MRLGSDLEGMPVRRSFLTGIRRATFALLHASADVRANHLDDFMLVHDLRTGYSHDRHAIAKPEPDRMSWDLGTHRGDWVVASLRFARRLPECIFFAHILSHDRYRHPESYL